jgi:hypothetical protein
MKLLITDLCEILTSKRVRRRGVGVARAARRWGVLAPKQTEPLQAAGEGVAGGQ